MTARIAQSLARRSSRRQFFKFLGAGSLGAALFLTRTDVALGSITGCVGCGGGPCNPCWSPAGTCESIGYPCKSCQQGGGCAPGCLTSGEWFCCQTGPPRPGCRIRCSECTCPPSCQTGTNCYCFIQLAIPCTPRRHSGDLPCPCPAAEDPRLAA